MFGLRVWFAVWFAAHVVNVVAVVRVRRCGSGGTYPFGCLPLAVPDGRHDDVPRRGVFSIVFLTRGLRSAVYLSRNQLGQRDCYS